MAKPTTDALEIMRRMLPDTPENRAISAETDLNILIAQLVYDAREASGLTQAQLAKKLGTSQSAISRQESYSYYGHTVSQLARLFDALDCDLEITLKPRKPAVNTKPKRARRGSPGPDGTKMAAKG